MGDDALTFRVGNLAREKVGKLPCCRLARAQQRDTDTDRLCRQTQTLQTNTHRDRHCRQIQTQTLQTNTETQTL